MESCNYRTKKGAGGGFISFGLDGALVEARHSSALARVCCSYIVGLSLVKISTYCWDSSLLVCSSG